MLDWISRPVEPGVFGAPDFVSGKLVAISGASGGSAGTYVMNELKGLLGRMAMKPLETMGGITLPMEAFTTGVFNLTDDNKAVFDNEIEAFLAELNK